MKKSYYRLSDSNDKINLLSKDSLLFFNAELRKVLISGEITEDNYIDIIDNIYLCAASSEEPITIFINTPGGEVFSSIAIMDAIRNINNEVIGIVTGYAASAGFYILQACDHRAMTANSVLFWHHMIQDNLFIDSKMSINKIVDRYNMINDALIGNFKERTKISKTNWKKYFEVDNNVSFDAKLSMELKLVDEILTYDKKFKV